jgi:2-haloacid dehalogenase
MLAFEQFQVLTFDCYGTLIDWESGILSALKPILKVHAIEMPDNQLLELYGKIEPEVQFQEFKPYRQVLREVTKCLASELSFIPSDEEIQCLEKSLPAWQPFPDTVESLLKLKKFYKLGILSNIDNDLFESSAQHLQVPFDYVMTAQQIGSYKPSPHNFKYALEQMQMEKSSVLHVAQSLFHDVVPAKQLGLKTVWVNRRVNQTGFGATAPAQAIPDLEIRDLATLAAMIESN